MGAGVAVVGGGHGSGVLGREVGGMRGRVRSGETGGAGGWVSGRVAAGVRGWVAGGQGSGEGGRSSRRVIGRVGGRVPIPLAPVLRIYGDMTLTMRVAPVMRIRGRMIIHYTHIW